MPMNEAELEKAIQAAGLNAPRLEPADIDDVIVGCSFTEMPSGKCMVCELTLTNGFTVRGESACVSPDNFDEAIGRDVSYTNARDKIWQLEGYLLQDRLHRHGEWKEHVAKVCHEANRAYCAVLGDFTQPSWAMAEQWQRDSALAGVMFHVEHPDAGPDASHENWRKHKADDGWVWGAMKKPRLKQHPCMVPFDKLPREQQAKDFIFRAIVHAMM